MLENKRYLYAMQNDESEYIKGLSIKYITLQGGGGVGLVWRSLTQREGVRGKRDVML